jgi:hypothetical protein
VHLLDVIILSLALFVIMLPKQLRYLTFSVVSDFYKLHWCWFPLDCLYLSFFHVNFTLNQ